MIIIDDCSTDGTGELIKNYIAEHNLYEKITLICNEVRCGASENFYKVISECDNETVIVMYDGDDWFAHDKALERIAQEYQDYTVWMTYGSWVAHPKMLPGNCRPLPESIIKNCSFREYDFVTSHPKTFYAWLFKKIAKKDFMYKREFLQICSDVALMFPILEMCSNGHIRYIPDILYIYNHENPISDFRIKAALQEEVERVIRRKKKYKPL